MSTHSPTLPGTVEKAETLRVVPVLVPLPLAGPYTYQVPDSVDLAPGDYVTVPLGPRHVRGVVWLEDDKVSAQDLDPKKIKPVLERLDAPPLSQEVMQFVDWVAAYTLFPQGAVLRMVMRSGSQLDPPRPQTGYLGGDVPDGVKLTPQREKVMKAVRGLNYPASIKSIAGRAGVSDGVVRALADAGALTKVETDPDAPFDPPNPNRKGKLLSPEQAAAAETIRRHVVAGEYACTLIDGVTGSGKTEVYLEAAAAALKADPSAQVLVMLPEIALTLPFLKRLEERFGAAPAPWHSDVGQAGRRRVWRRVADGSARLVVGARSALFLPYKNLKLIIVDEEHDPAYKQQDGVLYQARDMAIARAAHGGFPIVLASATPSLETVVNAQTGRFETAVLPSRFGGASMPQIDLIDMRENPPEKLDPNTPGWLSPILIEAVNDTLSRGEQAMLFLNRRGYAPLTICRKCGERMTAPDSDTWLVEHRFSGRLVCHHTGFSMKRPDTCPHCGAHDSLAACGPGVERIAEEATRLWPDKKIAIFSSDTVQNPAAGQEILRQMKSGEIDILVATQVAAKGHHFPNLTLVGVVDADLGLVGGDLRAGERTWQLLSQVIGRAGREEKPGRALLQSYQPEHPVITGLASGDRDAFMEAERDGREMLGFPPFGRLAALVLSGENEQAVNSAARVIAANVPQGNGIEVWGPAPAPLYRLRGSYRVRFLIKGTRHVSIQAFISTWLKQIKIPTSVRRTIDIDPYSFM